MTELITGFEGFLFIGDAHLANRPGRRIDDYASAILGKLSQSARIARERRLYPVCLGDLFHKARENDLELLAKTMAVLREFEVPLLVLAGSHDRTESWFTDKDAAQLLGMAGVVRLVEQPGKVLTLDCHGERVHLWAAPAGCPVPHEVDEDPTARNVMITHHDFDFRGMYPGAHELHEIANCDLMVNGHMHTPAPMVLKGRTACHNPGSISRVSVDLRKHEPVVSVWTPVHRLSLEPVPLTHVKDVFDLTGKEGGDQRIIPAPTVLLLLSSMMMKAPVPRFSRYGSANSGWASLKVTWAMSFIASFSAGTFSSVFTSRRWSMAASLALESRVVWRIR